MTSKTAPRIAFQGALGAYSHEACLQARPDMIPVPCMTFEGVIRAVREGRGVAGTIHRRGDDRQRRLVLQGTPRRPSAVVCGAADNGVLGQRRTDCIMPRWRLAAAVEAPMACWDSAARIASCPDGALPRP